MAASDSYSMITKEQSNAPMWLIHSKRDKLRKEARHKYWVSHHETSFWGSWCE